MWSFGTWFSGGLGSAELKIELYDLRGLFQSKQYYHSMTLIDPVMLYALHLSSWLEYEKKSHWELWVAGMSTGFQPPDASIHYLSKRGDSNRFVLPPAWDRLLPEDLLPYCRRAIAQAVIHPRSHCSSEVSPGFFLQGSQYRFSSQVVMSSDLRNNL